MWHIAAEMPLQRYLEMLRKDVGKWNAWRQEHPYLPDLSQADVSGADLPDADLNSTRMRAQTSPRLTYLARICRTRSWRAQICRTRTFSEADLRGANLVHANLTRANLTRAILNRANLRGVDLHAAILHGTNVRDAVLQGAHFAYSRFARTVLGDVDLRTAIDLDLAVHEGPYHRHRYQLPKQRQDSWSLPPWRRYPRKLHHVHVLADGATFEFFSCFISYSTKDQEFADRLYADLQAKGVRCWFAPHEIQGGRKVHEQIDEAIRVYDKLLLILSDASMNSNWVKTEIANARVREEQQKRQMLFPITLVPYGNKEWKLFDADTGIDSAREIREYFIPDFSNWKDHDSYQTAFERLLRDLKAEAREATAWVATAHVAWDRTLVTSGRIQSTERRN
jgi:uncharacterized protein YjbI with pentapeptide repeats